MAWYRKENAALREELAAEKGQKEQISRQVISDRELYSFLQENPETFRALQKELEAERKARAESQGKFEELAAAVRHFFRKNITSNSKQRTPERLGDLSNIPEIAAAVRLDLSYRQKDRDGNERTL